MIQVFITTYNRPEMLERLIDQLAEDAPDKVRIWVWQDGGDVYPNKLINKIGHVGIFQPGWHHGRERYWEFINTALDRLRITSFDWFVWLPDDALLVPGFLHRCMEMWNKISEMDSHAVCLNPAMDEARRGSGCWSPFSPVKFDDVWLTQWMDCSCFAPREMLDALGWRLEKIKPRRGRGSLVGMQISHRLVAKGYTLWQPDNTLWYHGLHQTMMHADKPRIK